MSTRPKTFLTPEQYLEIERKAEFKSEYYRGEMFAMDGARQSPDNKLAHDRLVANVNRELRTKLGGGDCRIVEAAIAHMRFDAVAVCDEPRLVDDQLLNPALLVEVTLPSTELYDCVHRFEKSRTVDSLIEYLLLASDRVSAHLFTRRADGRWLLTIATQLDDSLELQSIGCTLALSDLYERIELDESESAPWPPQA